jgi:hypothetical protein
VKCERPPIIKDSAFSKALGNIVTSQLQNLRKRPEGPSLNSPERELGVLVAGMMSAEGATQKQMRASNKRLIYKTL